MTWLFLIIFALVLCFGGVVLFGAPYVPILRPQLQTALDMLEFEPGQHLVELGCGDGKVLVAAAMRGWQVTAYELNPVLALIAWLRTRRYKGQVRVVWGDFWHKKLPPTDGIFVFLLPKYMPRLDKKIMQEISRPCKLVSYAFEVPGKKATVQNGVFLYTYRPS